MLVQTHIPWTQQIMYLTGGPLYNTEYLSTLAGLIVSALETTNMNSEVQASSASSLTGLSTVSSMSTLVSHCDYMK
jgi:hypothetical protein